MIASEIGKENKVLDVGCNKGYLKRFAPHNDFYGIDQNENDLEEAKKEGYKKVYQMDLDNYRAFKHDEKFDVIVFADILEHLTNPDKVLRFFVDNHLRNEGKVIISLPNVANFTIRLNLLLGHFDYAESGILDKTHLHLYTLYSARKFISGCGLRIIREKFSSNRLGKLIRYLSFMKTLLGYNLIFICKR